MEINLSDFVAMGSVLVVFILLYFFVKIFWEKVISYQKKRGELLKQIILVLVVGTGLIFFIMALPFSDSVKGNLMSLVGIVIAAAFSLSSTTFLGNLLAGVMNKIIGSFRVGDFIEVNGLFGRVCGIQLFHVEIQAVDRGLTTIPHLILATNAVKVTRSSGAIVFAEVSLGYDVSRKKIEECLKEAAKRTGLSDPFVLITALGDFSVVYKVHGVLKEVTKFLSVTSQLNGHVLDSLHEAGIEIVSPNFMNQRQVGEAVFIPKKDRKKSKVTEEVNAEAIIFDKAEQAEELEKKKMKVEDVEKRLKELKEEIKVAEVDAEKERIQKAIDRYTVALDNLKNVVNKEIEKLD